MGLKNDNNGVIPIIAWIAIFVVGAVGSYIAIENLTQQPNVTYNITESPFTFLGGAVDWIWIILIGVFVVFILLWVFGKSKAKEKPTQQYIPYRRD